MVRGCAAYDLWRPNSGGLHAGLSCLICTSGLPGRLRIPWRYSRSDRINISPVRPGSDCRLPQLAGRASSRTLGRRLRRVPHGVVTAGGTVADLRGARRPATAGTECGQLHQPDECERFLRLRRSRAARDRPPGARRLGGTFARRRGRAEVAGRGSASLVPKAQPVSVLGQAGWLPGGGTFRTDRRSRCAAQSLAGPRAKRRDGHLQRRALGFHGCAHQAGRPRTGHRHGCRGPRARRCARC